MTEADVIEQMVEYQDILLNGVQVFFTVVSAYVVAVWVFLRHAGFGLRLFSFFFLTARFFFLQRVGRTTSAVSEFLIAANDPQHAPLLCFPPNPPGFVSWFAGRTVGLGGFKGPLQIPFF